MRNILLCLFALGHLITPVFGQAPFDDHIVLRLVRDHIVRSASRPIPGPEPTNHFEQRSRRVLDRFCHYHAATASLSAAGSPIRSLHSVIELHSVRNSEDHVLHVVTEYDAAKTMVFELYVDTQRQLFAIHSRTGDIQELRRLIRHLADHSITEYLQSGERQNPGRTCDGPIS